MDTPLAERRNKSKQEKRRTLFWLTEAQAALTWGVILALAALVGAIYLYQTSRIASVGRQVQGLQAELDDIRRENARLELEIAEAESLEVLQEAAAQQGFQQSGPDNIEYLVVPDYPTAPQLTPTPAPTSLPEPIDSVGEALWFTLKASVGDLIRGESP